MTPSLWADIAVFPYEPPLVTVIVLSLFLLFMGACVGSFLNVVIYRVPAGLSIVKPRSRCPRCLTPILGRDNVPVIGWLVLRGRCRFCRTWIPARYPLVEATFGLAFLLLCWGEAIVPGYTLPIPFGEIEEYPLFGIAGYHFALVCGLGAAALMTYDGGVVPAGFWRVILAIGMLPPLVWPELRPIPFRPDAELYGRLVAGTADGAMGALVGALLGVAAWPVAVIGARARSGHLNSVAALAAVGAFLGWQAVLAVAGVVAALTLLQSSLRGIGFVSRFPWLGFVAITTFGFLLGWRWFVAHSLVDKTRWLGSKAPLLLIPAGIAGTFALALAAGKLHRPISRSTPANTLSTPPAATH
ncbi:MAG: prepilin peptidase [Planctomycetes bacterium]|nr:prepilin peptidase [Planctomycetota bacterium]